MMNEVSVNVRMVNGGLKRRRRVSPIKKVNRLVGKAVSYTIGGAVAISPLVIAAMLTY